MKKLRDVVKETGINRQRLQRLDQKGIVTAKKIGNGETNLYWYYSEEDVDNLKLVAILIDLGYKDKDISSIIQNSDGILKQKLQEIYGELQDQQDNIISKMQVVRGFYMQSIFPERAWELFEDACMQNLNIPDMDINYFDIKNMLGENLELLPDKEYLEFDGYNMAYHALASNLFAFYEYGPCDPRTKEYVLQIIYFRADIIFKRESIKRKNVKKIDLQMLKEAISELHEILNNKKYWKKLSKRMSEIDGFGYYVFSEKRLNFMKEALSIVEKEIIEKSCTN